MPESFPPVTEDIAFELLILHAVAERGRSLRGTRASALRSSLLWEAPRPQTRAPRSMKGLMHVASALVIASTLSLTPPASLPAWAQRNEIHITVVDVQSGKPLSEVVLRDSHGNALARTRADGKISFSVPSGEQRFTLERAGYQSVTLTRAQLGGSNLVSMRKAGSRVEPESRPTVKPSPIVKVSPSPEAPARPIVKPSPAPKATLRPTAKPTAAPKATPRPVTKLSPSPEATLRPTAKPVLQATPEPVQRPQAKPVPAQRPTATQGGRYVIKRGDTLWDIAAVTLGSPLKWPSLYEANRTTLTRPSLIYPGQTLVIPTGEAATKPSRLRGTHTVRRGESLWKIADSVYGDPLRWKALYQANRGIIKRPSLIYPGQTLVLPR